MDIVTTGTFEPMESSGAIINLGHTDPPIKLLECYLDGVPAYAGFGAVDLYLGASQPAITARFGENLEAEDIRELRATLPTAILGLPLIPPLPGTPSTSFTCSIPGVFIKTLLLV